MIIEVIAHLHAAVVSVPAPTPSSTDPAAIDATDIRNFLITKIAPILLAAVGVVFISRAGKGEMSRVLTSSGIVFLGIGFLLGGVMLLAFGNHLADVIFGPAPAP